MSDNGKRNDDKAPDELTPERVDDVLKANGLEHIRQAVQGAAGAVANLAPQALEASLAYMRDKRDSGAIKSAPPQAGDMLDADIWLFELMLETRGKVDELQRRLAAREDLRAGTGKVPPPRR